MNGRTWLRTAGSILVAVLQGACGELPASDRFEVSIDTLANGAVEVRNPRNGRWPGDQGWLLREDLRLGRVEGGEHDAFGEIRLYEVDRDGTIFILDGDAMEVRVFDAEGSYLRTLGRAGEGPGEFSQPWGLEVDGAGRIWVVDIGNQRYSIWSPGGRLVDEMRRYGNGNVAPWPGTVLDDGRVIDVESRTVEGERERRFVAYDEHGRALDSVPLPAWERPTFVAETESSRTSASVPFSPHVVRAFSPDGTLWTGISEEYRIVHRRITNPDTLRIIRKAYDPVEVTGTEADAAVARLAWFERQGGTIDRRRFPATHPAYQDFFVDDRGYLWTLPTLPRDDVVTQETLYAPRPPAFDVFDHRGVYLGRVEAPIPLRQPRVVGEHLYGVTVDELGVHYLVRFRIEGRRDI